MRGIRLATRRSIRLAWLCAALAVGAGAAVAAALNVVEPAMSGMGGYGTILVYDARSGRTRFLNPSGRMPASLDSDVFRSPTPDYRTNRRGAKAVSTPGNVNAWEAMWQKYGELPWETLFADPLRLAAEGFQLTKREAGLIGGAYASFPAHAQAFEPKGNPMDAFPGRHKLSGDVPLFIMRDGRPWIALGTPGGHTIAQTVPQMVMAIIDFDMDIQEAVDAPRIAFIEPDVIAIDARIPAAVRDSLASMGHHVEVSGGFSNAYGLAIEYDRRGRAILFRGAAESSGAGLARGYSGGGS